MRAVITAAGLALLLVVGIAGIVLGEGDDSPGLQGLGLLLAAGAVALGVRAARRNPRRATRGR